jgi:hypothetical protein
MVEAGLSARVECVELGHLSALPAHGARTLGWRQQLAEQSVQRAVELQLSGRHLLLSGDPVPAIEIVAAPSAPDLDGIAVCLLDISPDAQAQRLNARGDDPSVLVHHQAFAEWMRQQALDPLHMTHVVSDNGWEQMRWERLAQLTDTWAMHTIDTSDMTPAEVATAVERWIDRALRDEAPTLRVSDA